MESDGGRQVNEKMQTAIKLEADPDQCFCPETTLRCSLQRSPTYFAGLRAIMFSCSSIPGNKFPLFGWLAPEQVKKP